jgi:DNA-binding CsgD family transcriptional regulator
MGGPVRSQTDEQSTLSNVGHRGVIALARTRTVSRMSDGAHYRVATRHDLTPRQREVLGLIARGHTNPEIAERLGISLEGAKHHVSEILSKLDVPSREAAADWWRANRASPFSRFVRALWPWPAVGAAAVAGAVIAVVVAIALFGPNDNGPVAAVVGDPTTAALPRCASGELDYSMNESPSDGLVYFSVVATSPDAPCRATGDVNLVPVPARLDASPADAIDLDRNFSPQVTANVEPAGTTVLLLKWSNWCGSGDAIVWRPMATLFNTPAAPTNPPPFISDSAPDCTDQSQRSRLERVDGPLSFPGVILFVDGCTSDKITFSLYEEAPDRPGGSVFLEVRPASASCKAVGDLTAQLYVDGILVATQSVWIDALLHYVGFRVPFRWNGPCEAEDVRLEVSLRQSSATLYPTARPSCAGAPAAHTFHAGW